MPSLEDHGRGFAEHAAAGDRNRRAGAGTHPLTTFRSRVDSPGFGKRWRDSHPPRVAGPPDRTTHPSPKPGTKTWLDPSNLWGSGAMHKTLTRLALVLVALPALAVALTALAACNKVQARVELKKGNALYKDEAYAAALKQFQEGLRLDPGATFAWRSVGLTALALYKPGDESPQNEQYAKTATEAFEKYLADYPDDKKVREYLLTTYVNDKNYDR